MKLLFSFATCLFFTILMKPASAQTDGTQILRIKGAAAESGDVIVLPDSASIQVSTTSEGVELTLPQLDVRLRCLGNATSDGYCYIAAGAAAGSGVDTDGDGVPDEWENAACTATLANALTNSEGCADTDGDGYFTDVDACPTAGGNVGSDGCPVDSGANYIVDASAGTGGTINPVGQQTVESGSSISFTLTANSGYDLNGVTGSCGGQLSGNVFTTNAVTANCTVVANFVVESTGSVGACQGVPGGLVGQISCSNNTTLNNWELATANYPAISIPANKILSLPFTTGTDSTASGNLKINTLQYPSTGYQFRAWFSTVPGGDRLGGQGYCEFAGARGLHTFSWTQGDANFTCKVGAAGETLHFNMVVECSGAVGNCQAGQIWNQLYTVELTNSKTS